jgi:hypothetical protein
MLPQYYLYIYLQYKNLTWCYRVWRLYIRRWHHNRWRHCYPPASYNYCWGWPYHYSWILYYWRIFYNHTQVSIVIIWYHTMVSHKASITAPTSRRYLPTLKIKQILYEIMCQFTQNLLVNSERGPKVQIWKQCQWLRPPMLHELSVYWGLGR